MTDVQLTATLTEPLHHGAGNAGNTSLLRTQDVILPGGRQALVPFLSGNSLRHWLRATLAWDIVTHLDVADGSLSKLAVDLLWSGGAITSTGAETNLDLRRATADAVPHLGMLGYAAGSDITAGTLYMPNLHLVCAENAWRLPAVFADHPLTQRGAGSYRGEEFGTRHDIAGTPVDRYVQLAGDIITPKTTQMIYDMQVIKPGAMLTGTMHLTASATDTHHRMLAAAIELAAPAGDDGIRRTRLGAKNAAGFGACILDIDGLHIEGALEWWRAHLDTHADTLIGAVEKVVAS